MEIRFIQDPIDNNSSLWRTRLPFEICKIWNWCNETGKLKDISCRDMLRRMDASGQIRVPARFEGKKVKPRGPDLVPYRLHDTTPIEDGIRDILPIRISIKQARMAVSDDYKSLLAQYHFLGFDMTAGENIKYMVYSVQGQCWRVLYLILQTGFVSEPRDRCIGKRFNGSKK
jgi:hypothetical protein